MALGAQTDLSAEQPWEQQQQQRRCCADAAGSCGRPCVRSPCMADNDMVALAAGVCHACEQPMQDARDVQPLPAAVEEQQEDAEVDATVVLSVQPSKHHQHQPQHQQLERCCGTHQQPGWSCQGSCSQSTGHQHGTATVATSIAPLTTTSTTTTIASTLTNASGISTASNTFVPCSLTPAPSSSQLCDEECTLASCSSTTSPARTCPAPSLAAITLTTTTSDATTAAASAAATTTATSTSAPISPNKLRSPKVSPPSSPPRRPMPRALRERYLDTLEPAELRGKARRVAVRRALSSLQIALRRGQLGSNAAIGGSALPTTVVRTRLWHDSWESESESESDEEEAGGWHGPSCTVVEEPDGCISGTVSSSGIHTSSSSSSCSVSSGSRGSGEAVGDAAPKRVGYGQALKASRLAQANARQQEAEQAAALTEQQAEAVAEQRLCCDAQQPAGAAAQRCCYVDALQQQQQQQQSAFCCEGEAACYEQPEEDADTPAPAPAPAWHLRLSIPLPLGLSLALSTLPFSKASAAGSLSMVRSSSLERLQEAASAAVALAAAAVALPRQRDVRRCGIAAAGAALGMLQCCLEHCSPVA